MISSGVLSVDWYGVLPRCLGDSRPLSWHLRASEVSINSKVSLANGAGMCQFRRWWHLETCCVALLRRLWLRRCNACGLPLTYFLLFPVLVLLVPLQKPSRLVSVVISSCFIWLFVMMLSAQQCDSFGSSSFGSWRRRLAVFVMDSRVCASFFSHRWHKSD